MNIVDRYILENLDENIIVVTNANIGPGTFGPSAYIGIEIKGVGVLEYNKSILLEKDSVKQFLRTYGSSWAQIDYLHKYAPIANQDVYSKGYGLQLSNKGRYNGSYKNVSEANGRE